jgi:phosphomannomutase
VPLMSTDDLETRVRAWIADDPDPRDRAELEGLLGDSGAAARAELAGRFRARLEFGTAGLRGPVGAGPNRMNRAVVRATSAALARWLLLSGERAGEFGDAAPAQAGGQRGAIPTGRQRGVVIGCDARHRSAEFAAEAAATLAGAGLRVHLLPERQPTPLLAFAVRHLGAAAGVMITASHNPPADNGYKLYLADGAQIIPPADAEIEVAAAAIGPLSRIPVAPPDSPLITRYGDEIARAYLDTICALSPAPPGAAALRFCYTPLHGVAGELALRAFAQAGFAAPAVVSAQREPNPDFPTVAYPNPEQPGVLDLAIETARQSGAELVLANDPDGDRLAVAVPGPAGGGSWRMLTGDQVGALLGAYLLEYPPGRPDGRPGGTTGRLVVSTVVSSTLLSRIAAAAGAEHATTLTGFKWIARAGDARPDLRYEFGYEEALGYMIAGPVRDKDGIGAALALLGLAARARAGGDSLLDAYDALEAAHGVHLTGQVTVPSRAPQQVMARLRAEPPKKLGGLAVDAITDYGEGSGGLPPAEMLGCQLDGARVIIRPSGTEPKIKAYLEVVEPVAGGRLDTARRAAREVMGPLRDAVRALLGDGGKLGT